MGHDPGEGDALRMHEAAQRQQFGGAGGESGAVPVAVDFYHRGKALPGTAREVGKVLRRLDAVENEGDAHAPGEQGRHMRQFARRNGHGVEHVVHAVRGEVFGLVQRRDGDGALWRVHQPARHFNALIGLDVRAERHTKAR